MDRRRFPSDWPTLDLMKQYLRNHRKYSRKKGRLGPYNGTTGRVNRADGTRHGPTLPGDINDSSDESRSQFAATSGTVLQGAYRDGAHIRMRYDQDGSITEEGDGVSVIEYYRCGGWEWTPVSYSLHLSYN